MPSCETIKDTVTVSYEDKTAVVDLIIDCTCDDSNRITNFTVYALSTDLIDFYGAKFNRIFHDECPRTLEKIHLADIIKHIHKNLTFDQTIISLMNYGIYLYRYTTYRLVTTL